MMTSFLSSIQALTVGQAGWAIALATIATTATFAWARAGSVWPCSAALLTAAVAALLWMDPSPVIDHARTYGVGHWLPETYGSLSQWFAATAAGAAAWALASVAGLAAATLDR